jgi:hypothetical protein
MQVPVRWYPVLPSKLQTFNCTLNGRSCTITLRYNDFNSRWYMDISMDGVTKVTGRMLPADVDVMRAYDLDIGRLVAAMWEANSEPDYDNFTTNKVRLVHATEEEALAIRSKVAAELEAAAQEAVDDTTMVARSAGQTRRRFRSGPRAG